MAVPRIRYIRADADGAGDGTTQLVGGGTGAWTWNQMLADEAKYGDTYYLKSGTYALTADFESGGGNGGSPVIFEGWDVTPGDTPIGNNRPLIAAGSFQSIIGECTFCRNIRFTSTNVLGAFGDGQVIFTNCSAVNSAPLLSYAAAFGGRGTWINCDASSNYIAFEVIGPVIGCLGYNSPSGIQARRGLAFGNILYNCTFAGISIWPYFSGDGTFIQNNTFWSCDHAINGTDGHINSITSNIFDNGNIGVYWDVPTGGHIVWLDNNNYGDLNDDEFNCDDGGNSTHEAPGFFNQAAGDYRIGPVMKGAGFPTWTPFFDHILGEDLTNFPDQGALQRAEIVGETAAVVELGANARSKNICVKLSPTATADALSWVFEVPASAYQITRCSLYHKITTGFNGSLLFSASGSGITPIVESVVTLIDDDAYHNYLSDYMTPSIGGYITIILQAYDGIVSGDIFIDDITTTNE